MGSSGLDSLINHNITPFDNPKLELGCNMVDTFTKIGESITDFHKENPPNYNNYSKCQKCGEKFQPKNIEKICNKCYTDELSNRIRNNNSPLPYFAIYCKICNNLFIKKHENQLYCDSCIKFKMLKTCLKCGTIIPKNREFCYDCQQNIYSDWINKFGNENKNSFNSGVTNSRPYYYPNNY